ncbi:hypothetical protein [Parasphingorhabdus pacifica]
MRGYSIHLFFHLLAALLGGAAGVAAGLWWVGEAPAGLWLAIGALLVGLLVLVVESLYLPTEPGSARRPPSSRRRQESPSRQRQESPSSGSTRITDTTHAGQESTRVLGASSATGTRPELEPVAAPEPPEDRSDAPTRRN